MTFLLKVVLSMSENDTRERSQRCFL